MQRSALKISFSVLKTICHMANLVIINICLTNSFAYFMMKPNNNMQSKGDCREQGSMSEIRLNRTNLLNNDSLPDNKRFDRLSSGARRDCNRDPTESRFGGRRGRADDARGHSFHGEGHHGDVPQPDARKTREEISADCAARLAQTQSAR